jgi:phosphatidylinositol glycan class T
MPLAPVLSVQRFLSGSGHEWGGLHTEVTNSHSNETLRILYLDMIPWFCRVYVHTLQVEYGEYVWE